MISAERLPAAAWSYYEHRNRFVYSWAGQTFLSGSALFDPSHEDRGNIDCSTFVHLALMGISYENSPYACGNPEDLFDKADRSADPLTLEGLKESLKLDIFRDIDFGNEPSKVGNTREIAARRYLAKQDLEATPERIQEVLEKQSLRNAFGLAQHLMKRGLTYEDPAEVLPGDIAFFRAYPRWIEGYKKFGIFMEISHVGIITENTAYMLHATGSHDKDKDLADGDPIKYEPVSGKRVPCLFAHCSE